MRTRTESFTLPLPRHWARVSGGFVWTHGFTQNSLPSGQRVLQQRILVHTCRLIRVFFVSATYVFFFLSSLSSSRSSLFKHWKLHTLTKTLQSDSIGASSAAAYFSVLSSPLGLGISTGCSVSATGLQLQSPSLSQETFW